HTAPSAARPAHRPPPFSVFLLPQPPTSTLFPYTTLFRSDHERPAIHQPRERHHLIHTAQRLGIIPPMMRQERRRPQHRRHLPHQDRKSTRLNSSHLGISYAVFCLKKKKKTNTNDVRHSNQ